NVQVEEGIHLSDCATALSRRSLQSYVEEGRKGKAVELGGTKQHCTLVAEDTFGNFINPRPCQGEVPVEITDPQQPVIGLTYDPSARGRNGFLPQRFLLLRDFAWHEGVKVDFSAAAAAQHVQFELDNPMQSDTHLTFF